MPTGSGGILYTGNYRDSVKGLFNPSLQYLLAPLLCANLKKIDMT